jgi:hypothetical protein
MKTHYVYKLTDLITEEYYIGVRSCQGPAEEDRAYRGSMKSWKLTEEQKLYLDKNILKTFSTREEAEDYESELILQAKELKDLLNKNGYIPNKGFSKYGFKATEETRKKMSEAQKGKTFSEETRKKLSEANKGKTHTEEARKKVSEANKGNQYTKGIIHSEETRKKRAKSLKGKTRSEETRKKMSEAHKGKKMKEESCKKMSESAKGRLLPEEVRKKISEAAKNRWKNKNLNK